MNNITIGRYKAPQSDAIDLGFAKAVIPVSSAFDGWIEGTRDDGSTWIMWLDAVGNPLVYFAQRGEDGAVEGVEPIVLAPEHPYLEG